MKTITIAHTPQGDDEMNAIEKFTKLLLAVTVPVHALDRAISNLPPIEALALIRATYTESDGGYCTLEHAKEIYRAITSKSFPGK